MTDPGTAMHHAFLTLGHNNWFFWTASGSRTLTNPGATHRVFESLAFALDTVARAGWRVKNIYLDAQQTPILLFLTRVQEVEPETEEDEEAGES
jgi:hypothetical protein